MAIAFRAASSWANNASTSNITVTKPTGTVSGDVMVAIIQGDQSYTFTNASGWTTLDTWNASTGVRCRTVYKVAGGSEPSSYSFAIGSSGTDISSVCMSFSGVDNTTPVRDHKTVGSATSSRTSPALTGTQATDMVVILGGARPESANGSAAITAPSTGGWTKPAAAHSGPSNNPFNFPGSSDGAYQIAGTTGTFTMPVTSGMAVAGISLIAAATSNPVPISGTTASVSSASAALTRLHGQHLTGTLTSVSDASATTLGLAHGFILTGTLTSITGLSGAISTVGHYKLTGTATSLSGASADLTVGHNHQISGTVESIGSAEADLTRVQPPPYAHYEFFIDWDRDNGLRISDFETGFDGWTPTDLLSISNDHSYAGGSSLKASWQNQTPSPNDADTFIFGSSAHGFDDGLFAVTSEDPADDEVLSITYDLSGLRVGEPYTLSMWVFVPKTNGQHIKAGIRDVASSDATDETEKWLNLVVPFTPTATEHTLFIDAAGTVTDDNFTYIDYIFVTGEFEDITERVRIEDISWNYGRDQSRALNPVTPAETEIVVDNQDGFLAPNNVGSPLHDFLLPNRELLIRATFRSHTYDLLRVYLDDISEDPYITEQEVKLSAVDPLASIAGGQLSTQVWMGVRTGDAINHVLDEIGWPENRRDIDPGATVISHFWVEGQDASDAITDLVASEGPPAYATVSDAGYFIFRDRHHRILRTESTEVQATFSPTEVEPCFSPPAEINIGWKDIINSVTFAVNERSTIVTDNEEGSMGEAPSVWKYEGTFSVPAGESRVFHVTADSPVLFFQAPELRKGDYAVAGGDVQFTLSRTSGETTELTVFAPTQDIAVTNLIVRGYPINTVDGIVVNVVDENSVAKVGPKADTENVDAPWANANDAQAIGDIITRTRGRRLPTMSITLKNGTPERLLEIFKRRLSDLVHIIEPRSFTHHDFYIESIEHTISDGGKLHTTKFGCEMVPDIIEPEEESLTPFTFGDEYSGFDSGVFAYDTIQADPDKVFILDVSELDSDDGLGF